MATVSTMMPARRATALDRSMRATAAGRATAMPGAPSLPFVLLAAVAVAIMLGTLAERRWGMASAHLMIYAAPWFYALWAALAVSTLRTLVLRRLWRNPAVGGLHVGLMVVLCGGALSAAFSSRGCLHVRVR